MANPDDIQRIFANINDFAGFLEVQFSNASISNLIESITYNTQSQTVVIKIRDLLTREADRIQRERVTSDPDAEEELRRLSERYRESYPQFLECYNKWKPKRRELIRTSSTSANQIDLNISLISALRIVTSTADIIGTVQLLRNETSSWSLFAFENASFIGMGSLFLEMTLSKQYHTRVKTIIREDQKRFEELRKWFGRAEDLDIAVRTFFPYGIDKDLVRRIDSAASETDQYNKLFMSIIASNVKNDVNLFTNRIFLDKADKFATSEVGIQWFRKVILENDPVLHDCINRDLTIGISSILNSSMQNLDMLIGTSTLLATKAKFKMLLSGITIFSAVSNLWNDTKNEDSDILRELATKAERELHAITRVLELLRPSGVDIGDALL